MTQPVSQPTAATAQTPEPESDTEGYVWSPPGAPYGGCIPPIIGTGSSFPTFPPSPTGPFRPPFPVGGHFPA